MKKASGYDPELAGFARLRLEEQAKAGDEVAAALLRLRRQFDRLQKKGRVHSEPKPARADLAQQVRYAALYLSPRA